MKNSNDSYADLGSALHLLLQHHGIPRVVGNSSIAKYDALFSTS